MSQRGAALGVALMTLAIVGGVISTAFLVGLQEQRIGLSTLRSQEAFAAAERAAHQLVAGWDPERYHLLPVGSTVHQAGTEDAGPGWHRTSIRRLTATLFLVLSEGFSPDSTARQPAGRLLRLTPIPWAAPAALNVSGRVDLRAGAWVSGRDTPPGAWMACPAGGETVPGIRAGMGVAPTTEDLRALATHVLPAGTYRIGPSFAGGTCDRAMATNWGDPLTPESPCGTFFPVVWAEGPLSLYGGVGQGILVVNGDLELGGGVEFYGAVWVTGSLRTVGSGGRISGAVSAGSATLSGRGALGGPVVTFSSCALTRALASSARVTYIQPRGWLEPY